VWKKTAEETGLKINVSGIPPLSHFSFEYDNELAIATFFTQEMLKRRFLAWTQFKSSYAHRDIHINKYSDAVYETFRKIKKAIEKNYIEKRLKDSIAKKGFYRLVKN